MARSPEHDQRRPDLYTSFEYDGRVSVEWHDVLRKEDIPDVSWQQAYVIGNFDGKVPVVIYPDDRDNLPGGKTELGESIDQTIRREIEEELNMRVVTWEPLGYQVCTREDTDEAFYQLRVYAHLEKIGEFTNDPGGAIIGHRLVELNELNVHIHYGVIGERLIGLAKRFYESE